MRGVLVGPAPGVFRNEFRNLASYLVVVLDLSDSKEVVNAGAQLRAVHGDVLPDTDEKKSVPFVPPSGYEDEPAGFAGSIGGSAHRCPVKVREGFYF